MCVSALSACMYIHHTCAVPTEVKRVHGPLGLELENVVSHHMGAENPNPGPLQEQSSLSSAEPRLQGPRPSDL